MGKKASKIGNWVLWSLVVGLLGNSIDKVVFHTEKNDPADFSEERVALAEKIDKNEPHTNEVYISDANVLYVGVKDDGNSKNALAQYYCQSYGDEGDLIKVLIVKSGTRHILGQIQCQ